MNNTHLTFRPFSVSVSSAEVADLQDRLARTRLPQPSPVDDWDVGTPNSYLREAVDAWRAFDWAAAESKINAVPHFTTEIDGQNIHFIHVRSSHEGATPLLLAHTYPGSSIDYLEMIDQLVDPAAHGGRAEDAFDVVIPDAPGYGYSQPLASAGWTTARVAAAYDQLMRGLGYDSYGIHGSDNGAMVARELGLLNPEGFLGLHVLQLFSFPSGDPSEFEKLEPAGLRGPRAHAVVPVGRRLQHDELLTAADDRRRDSATRRSDSWPTASCSTTSATAPRSCRWRRSCSRSA